MDARDPLMVWVDRAYGCDRGDLPRGGGAVAARGGGLVFAAVGVLLAGCSSSGPKASPPTTIVSSVASTKASSVAPAPVTTVGSTSTSTTTTTLAPTTTSTTTDPKATAEAAVRAAIVLAEETFSACLVAMPHCDPQTLAVARTGQLLARNVALISDWNAQGFTVREREKFRFVIESVSLAEGSLDRATALVCIVDDSVRVRPGVGPGGADIVVNDSFISGRTDWQMMLGSDGVWRSNDGVAIGPTEDHDVCAPS